MRKTIRFGKRLRFISRKKSVKLVAFEADGNDGNFDFTLCCYTYI